jgi:hypothetical protein
MHRRLLPRPKRRIAGSMSDKGSSGRGEAGCIGHCSLSNVMKFLSSAFAVRDRRQWFRKSCHRYGGGRDFIAFVG